MIASLVDTPAPWNREITDVHAVFPVTELPAGIAQEARDATFAVADLAVASLGGQPMLAVLSFAIHEHTFAGNINMILRDSIQTIEMTMRRRGRRRPICCHRSGRASSARRRQDAQSDDLQGR